jgi:hypothetical protein
MTLTIRHFRILAFCALSRCEFSLLSCKRLFIPWFLLQACRHRDIANVGEPTKHPAVCSTTHTPGSQLSFPLVLRHPKVDSLFICFIGDATNSQNSNSCFADVGDLDAEPNGTPYSGNNGVYQGTADTSVGIPRA